ncbi:MAG: response regulator [Bryobacteraceae bacterium]
MDSRAADRKVRVLVIEDNPADVELLRLALNSAQIDCELTVLEDGAEALAFIRQVGAGSQEGSPDLTVLDLNLPKRDGVEVLQAIRATGAFAGAPVAVLSSSASPRERARIEQFNIGRYITKPANLDEFLNIGFVLKQLLRECGPPNSSA